MPTLKKIEEDLESVSTIKNIVQSYQEIANLRMNLIREKVLKNRKFFVELSSVYQRTKAAYLLSIKKGWIKEKKIPVHQPKKEKVIILLSANKFFYGPLILNIWQETQVRLRAELKAKQKKNNIDLAVIGKVGKYLAEQDNLGFKMFYFELDDENPEPKQIKKIIEFVKSYKKIFVSHGKYDTVLRQSVVISDISGGLPSPKKGPRVIKNYLFEPSPEAILEFFEREIIATLFNQTLLEHQLARYASRMIAMHQATENAKESQKKLKLLEAKLQKQIINKKQIEIFGNINI
jgi:F-type H+-transporting ATPase subunit gamma